MPGWRDSKPPKWSTFLSKLVKVSAHNNQYEGWVFTVDPVSASMVLVTFPEGDQAHVRVVLGHAVESVEVLQDGNKGNTTRLASIFSAHGTETLSPEKLRHRRHSLCQWIEKNHIPVKEEGEMLRVANVLTISSPYGVDDCSSSNEIILSRVQGLVRSNPGQKY
ncbi:gem-associated protein 6 [Alosa sapidissima]|uniref:gem-associated protein 6 n=1 Tax=Alosa sapidissima TaxID=34773 RepID=UPI001C08C249|nr:gem-associated protein 6 [Alosa sapidissima]